MGKKTSKVTKKAAKVSQDKPDKKATKSQKLAEREKAVKEARQQLQDSLHALVMSAPSLSEASEIIEKEILQARRTMLEEWY